MKLIFFAMEKTSMKRNSKNRWRLPTIILLVISFFWMANTLFLGLKRKFGAGIGGVMCVDFTRYSAVLINLLFRLADLFIVSCLFDYTSKEGDNVSQIFQSEFPVFDIFSTKTKISLFLSFNAGCSIKYQEITAKGKVTINVKINKTNG